MQESYRDILKLLLPTIIVENFELTSYQTTAEVMHFYLQEINQILKDFQNQKLESKNFFDEITVQDFPIRGHKVFLHIKRRRWGSHTFEKVVYRNWDLVADGARITKEFAVFLSELSDSNLDATQSIEGYSGVNNNYLSIFRTWPQRSHARD